MNNMTDSDKEYFQQIIVSAIKQHGHIFPSSETTHMFADMKEDLISIKEQTTKHNGRMTTMERWQAYMTGAITVLTIVVVPILSWALWVLVNIDTQVNFAVTKALSVYDITSK